MTTKLLKVVPMVATILMIILTIMALATPVFALTVDPSGIKGTDTQGASTVESWGKQILGIVQTVGTMASIIILVILGIKYMLGSTEEKAEYKKTMMPYVIGAVFIFGASRIAGYIAKFASTNV